MEEEYGFDMVLRVSHETIYRYIDVLPRGSLKITLIKVYTIDANTEGPENAGTSSKCAAK